jgi:hypothetical protein
VNWWKGAVIYEIYPSSFGDTKGDGNRRPERRHGAPRLPKKPWDRCYLDHAFFPFPEVDFGYDISNYGAIDPQYGTMADFDRLVTEAGRRDIGVIADMVLNHTSDQHPWFIESKSSQNSLANEPDAAVIAKCLGISSCVRLTEANLAEIAATKNPEKRKKLVETCQRLVGIGECIGPHHWIIEQQVNLYATRPDIFNWQRIDVRMRALEEEITRPQFLNDDTVAAESRADFDRTEKEFGDLFRDARAAFPIPKSERIHITLPEVVELSLADGSAHWRMAADFYE